ncbi:MAG: phospho-N-acetylmuramoyl-pentapeptide-transferase [Firmicutes bacterium]|nr:phospho-N-acetylmuramoyl-pentapeptide-transferase [Bacillota bacterium]
MDIKGLLMWELLAFAVSFAVTAALGPIFIPWLHKLKFGQEIREEGPKWHQKKSGTPTMGGIMFIVGTGAAILVTSVIAAVKGGFDAKVSKGIVLFAVSLGFGAIGFVDDYIKVVKKRNLGLTAIQKFLLQVILAAVYIAAMYAIKELNPQIIIPFTDIVWDVPMWLYIPIVMFIVVGAVNAVNLTDGLDGLASSVTVVVTLFFALAAYLIFNELGDAMFAAAVMGGLIGFLIYNHYPAKVFMGDTGSLFLGAVAAFLSIDLGLHLFLIIVGFVYIAETLSVIMQTMYFKYTKKKYGEGRRIFKMTPIHHHFEMCGWKETKIVTVFTLVTALLCIVARLGIRV